VTDDTLSVDREDGRTPAERVNVRISGAGYGLQWPELDEEIGVEGLLLGKPSTESAASFERWLQRCNAR
jgi:hypothetical protein